MTDKLRITENENDIAGKLSLMVARRPLSVKSDIKQHSDGAVLRDALHIPLEHQKILKDIHLINQPDSTAKRHIEYQAMIERKYEILVKALDLCDNVGRCLLDLNENYVEVSKKTSNVDTDCQALLREQEDLAHTAKDLRKKIQFFNEAHRISGMVKTNDLAMKMVTGPDLHLILEKLDTCKQFMKTHAKWKEAQRYLGVFTRLEDRVLKAVRLHFTAQLRAVVATLRKNNAGDPDLKMTSAKAFVEFQNVASKIKPLIESFEKKESSEQHQMLLGGLQETFAQCRLQMLKDEIQTGWQKDLDENFKLPDAIRHCCSFLVSTLGFEYQLFEHFFEINPASKAVLHSLLGKLSSFLYTGIRPLLIREMELEPISQAIVTLKREVLEQQVLPRGEAMSPFVSVIKRLLQDMQLRLAYRAQRYINEQIAGFEPSAEDLDYPNCLLRKSEEGKSIESKSKMISPSDKKSALKAAAADTKQADMLKATGATKWFPTISRTVMCLFKLHECVEAGAFSHLAQEALSQCSRSLKMASQKILSKSGEIHAQLFMIKYLLILRSQISVLNIIRHHENLLDFSHMKDIFSNVVAGKASLETLLRQGTPSIVKKEINAKKNLQIDLKLTCERLIAQQSDVLVGKLAAVLQEVSNRMNQETSAEPAADDITRIYAVLEDMLGNTKEESEGRRKAKIVATKKGLDDLSSHLKSYLENVKLERMLLDPIIANMKKAFGEARDCMLKSKSKEVEAVESCLLQLESELIVRSK
mmetsp:Transcript_19961/g.29883  ORF Transcript_19961/g.29883 Transcript_19961/m.29883 type:complete len:757 (+) Transcript_19961:57-2327(+)